MPSRLTRRSFIRHLSACAAWIAAVTGGFGLALGNVWAAVKRKLLPAGTPREALANMTPSLIDARKIPLTPLNAFEVLGTDDYRADMERWRLNIVGAVSQPLRLSYDELLQQPAVERKVPLICPLTFANQGCWKGVAIRPLLQRAGLSPEATHLAVEGPEGDEAHRRIFTLDDVREGKLFLCYAVNGEPLPIQHGYPLRLVADDEYGDRWVKYVYLLEALAGGEETLQENFTPGL